MHTLDTAKFQLRTAKSALEEAERCLRNLWGHASEAEIAVAFVALRAAGEEWAVASATLRDVLLAAPAAD